MGRSQSYLMLNNNSAPPTWCRTDASHESPPSSTYQLDSYQCESSSDSSHNHSQLLESNGIGYQCA
ncbi:hypothetical protein Sjap_004756 [Stephania japonica]|uniref:Uncharacterized protein n=1 Tax=Stephania japonica TaxID=461633 RepID=A0AAP0K2T2_9MAGN